MGSNPLASPVPERCFPPFRPSTLASARIIAAAFGLLFFGSFYCLVIQRLNIGAALLATFFLVSSPMILLVSLSVIQEVPAFAVGLLSLCLLFRWIECRKPIWALAFGLCHGPGISGIKLTAGIMFPAIFVEFVLTQSARKPGGLKGLLTTGWPMDRKLRAANFLRSLTGLGPGKFSNRLSLASWGSACRRHATSGRLSFSYRNDHGSY